MNSKIVTLAVAVLSLAVVATTASLSTTVYAEKAADPNCFGEEASQLGQSGQMGKHSSDPIPDGEKDHDTPRDGIGNVGGKGSETHPSELAEDLNGDEECEVEEED